MHVELAEEGKKAANKILDALLGRGLDALGKLCIGNIYSTEEVSGSGTNGLFIGPKQTCLQQRAAAL